MKEVNNEKIVLASAFRRQVRPPQWWNPMDISRYSYLNAGLIKEAARLSRFDAVKFLWSTAIVISCAVACYAFLELMGASKVYFYCASLPVFIVILVFNLALYSYAVSECRKAWSGPAAVKARDDLAAMTDEELNLKIIELEVEKAKAMATGFGSRIYALVSRLAVSSCKAREVISGLELRSQGTAASNEEREYVKRDLAALRKKSEVLFRDFERADMAALAVKGLFYCLFYRIKDGKRENLLEWLTDGIPVEESYGSSEVDVQLAESLALVKTDLENLAVRITESLAEEENRKA